MSTNGAAHGLLRTWGVGRRMSDACSRKPVVCSASRAPDTCSFTYTSILNSVLRACVAGAPPALRKVILNGALSVEGFSISIPWPQLHIYASGVPLTASFTGTIIASPCMAQSRAVLQPSALRVPTTLAYVNLTALSPSIDLTNVQRPPPKVKLGSRADRRHTQLDTPHGRPRRTQRSRGTRRARLF